MSHVLLNIKSLNVSYRSQGSLVPAVKNVSFDIRQGETLALIGESGCGKTSLGKAVVGLQEHLSGKMLFKGRELQELRRNASPAARRPIQMVFQDPLSALDPRQPAWKAVDFPLKLHSRLGRHARREKIASLFSDVGLDDSLMNRYPHQLSGGQRQRLNIARALAPEPELIICDEPVSALDVSLQSQITQLLGELQLKTGVSLLFISHDISVVEKIAHRIAVMYDGELLEIVDKTRLWQHAQHPYTRRLLSAIPGRFPDQRRINVSGSAVNQTPSFAGNQK